MRLWSRRRLVASLATVAALLAAAGPAKATTLLENFGVVNAVVGQNTTLFNTSNTSENPLIVAQNSGTGFDAAAVADTDYRENHATALANKSVADGFTFSQASSKWRDDILILNAVGPTVNVGFLFHLSGALSAPGVQNAIASFDFDFDVEDDTCCSDSTGAVWRSPIILTDEEILLVAEAEAGTWIGISAELIVSASVSRNLVGSAFATFGASAVLTEVILPDGVTIQSESGTNYMSAIPEPGTAVLSVLALAGLALDSRRGRS